MHPIEECIRYQFSQIDLLEKALTHKSYRNEKSMAEGDNEKLEFLGDAVLDLALSEVLMRQFPTDSEGSLSKKRASLVNEDSLSQVARDMGVAELLRVGKGERQTGGLQRPRLLASALEAILGAVFMDGGYDRAASVIAHLFHDRVLSLPLQPDFALDFKTRLQEEAQAQEKKTPRYSIVNESGPDHEKIFEVSVQVGDLEARGLGRNKKAAEQEAARNALDILQNKNSPAQVVSVLPASSDENKKEQA